MPSNFYAHPNDAMRACEEEIQRDYPNLTVWAGVYATNEEAYFYIIATPDQDWESIAPSADCTLIWERPNNEYWQLAPGIH
jgi:hypothetical protein